MSEEIVRRIETLESKRRLLIEVLSYLQSGSRLDCQQKVKDALTLVERELEILNENY